MISASPRNQGIKKRQFGWRVVGGVGGVGGRERMGGNESNKVEDISLGQDQA